MAIVKTPVEIEALRCAANATQIAFARALPFIRVGVTERFLADKLEKFARALPDFGALSFPPIIASGPNGAGPHAEPTDRVLQNGDLVTVDFGVTIGGYASDMTRTFLLGRPSEKQREIYLSVQNAQAAGLAATKAGVACATLDSVCRDLIAADGYGEYFIHTTGHGVGTQVHEDPRIGKNSEAILQAGMVVTIEPGIYIEGLGGVRIEDTVLVTETGCEVLTPKISKEFISL